MRTQRPPARSFLAAMALLWAGASAVAEPSARLFWRNGDVLPGALLESGPGRIRWASPLFPEPVSVDLRSLDTISFPPRPAESRGAFRITTISGDLFTAEVVGADDREFTLAATPFGEFRLLRRAVRSLERVAHPDLVFDGSQASAWGVERAVGPVRDLTFRGFDGSREWPRWTGDGVPDVSRLAPRIQGSQERGFLDLALAYLKTPFVVHFQGRIEAPRAGEYTFKLSARDAARLYVDGSLAGIALGGRELSATVRLGIGFHTLRLEFSHTSEGQHPVLDLRWSGPDLPEQALSGFNPPPGWRQGTDGRLECGLAGTALFHLVDLPERFEIDAEFTSRESPRFVLGLDRFASSGLAPAGFLQVATSGNELAIMHGDTHVPMPPLRDDERAVGLRLLFDGGARRIELGRGADEAVLEWEPGEPAPKPTGILFQNWGRHLAVERLRVWRRPASTDGLAVELPAPWVRTVRGEIIPGRLWVQAGRAGVVDAAGNRRAISLEEVDRIADEHGEPVATPTGAELALADGATVRGAFLGAGTNTIVLQPAFAEAPLTCALAGAEVLRFHPGEERPDISEWRGDELFHAGGHLRGRLSFAGAGFPLRWIPEGGMNPLRLDALGGARIELQNHSLRTGPTFDGGAFTCMLHLKTGEAFPVRVRSGDGQTLHFESPYLEHDELAWAHLKAIDFLPAPTPHSGNQPAARDDWFQAILRRDEKAARNPEPDSLDRVLTIPRFEREDPPTHVLVAKTGDLKRGRLVAIGDGIIRFASKQRVSDIPLDRIARVVDIAVPAGDSGPMTSGPAALEHAVRVVLDDGSILRFEPTATSGGRLLGSSPVYGRLAIPIRSIQRVSVGDFEKDKFELRFSEWMARPAREPEYGERSPRILRLPGIPEAKPPPVPTRPSPAAPPAPVVEAAPPAVTVAPPADPAASSTADGLPELGVVRVDARDRSFRFPVELNQRTGLIEYALVQQRGKTHESLFRTAAEPLHLHLAFLLLGGKPAYSARLPVDILQALPGEAVRIEVVWQEKEAPVVKPLEAFIVTTDNPAPLAPGPWAYNGSMMLEQGLAAQAEGSIVSLYLDPSALINNPRPGRNDDELHRPNTAALPPDATPLEMVVRLIGKPQPPREP
ncbi:MAG: hypothetical protein H7A47_17400 [Verrucomicrobiales bacterium]|nr:hypothetical protein [Verrucomicrobiales bacterium]